jgi:hypothetical protein
MKGARRRLVSKLDIPGRIWSRDGVRPMHHGVFGLPDKPGPPGETTEVRVLIAIDRTPRSTPTLSPRAPGLLRGAPGQGARAPS